ncbi:MAG: hypothetical protein HY513_02240 [Candidatus Aenigmarchaeota archaeon]|nr:hypothetical protein [Candidatus Aenigmarchaeota archaeon]
MDEYVADALLDKLSGHQGLMPLDRAKFQHLLIAANVPDSSRFYDDLSGHSQAFPAIQQIEDDRRYGRFSLRRILRNRNVRDYRLSTPKRALETVLAAFGTYSSDSLSRSIRANKHVVELMAICPYPFSLLGKLETFDYGNTDERLFRVIRPILVIPGTQDDAPVYRWEDVSTKYHEAGWLGFSRTTKRAYLTA